MTCAMVLLLAPMRTALAQAGTEAAATETPGPVAKAAPAVPETQADEAMIRSRKDKISYAFGVDLGRDLKRQQNDLNVDLLMRALRDTLAGKALIMADEQVNETLKSLAAEQQMDYEHAKSMIAEKNKRTGEAFFAENARKEGVITLPSGLQYKILKKGEGQTPGPDDKVTCRYRATLLDGTEFDSSDRRGHDVTFAVKGVLAGWSQALQMMPAGSKWQLFVPPQLAYSDKIVNGIGPFATLVFELELVSIEAKPQTADAR